MKYISSELRSFWQSETALSGWSPGNDLVICSFFFWNLGSALQKNYVRFLRSILYQIAEQREDAIPIMMGQHATSSQSERASDAGEFDPIHAWTRERLDDALKRFLQKAASVRIIFVIDGADEFVGDQDSLLETIRLLNQTSSTRVCVSSRPEQIFRQGFADSPQLKLQDLNYHDIKKATRGRLRPMLRKCFPNSLAEIDCLVNSVIQKSQGIFLWAELMNKDILRGVRNADDMQELRERLERTPDTIDGLHQHMLSRLEKVYLEDTAKYFHMLMADGESFTGNTPWPERSGLTLLHFVCAEESTRSHILSKDHAYFQSSEFDDLCRKMETRILTRCVGLVEIDELRQPDIAKVVYTKYSSGPLKLVREGVANYLREVRFIHKTTADLVRKHKEFIKDPKSSIAATLAVTRSRIEVIGLLPLMMQREISPPLPLVYGVGPTLRNIVSALPVLEAYWPFEEDR